MTIRNLAQLEGGIHT